jgi:signal transduction histidine kinase
VELKEKKNTVNLLTSTKLRPVEYCQNLIKNHEAEKKRIAYNLHDSVGQNLIIAKLNLDRLADNIDSITDKSNLESAIEKIQLSIDDLRKISSEIRPKILDDVGLCAALKSLINDYENSSVKFTLNLDVEENVINYEHKLTIYRIIQELLTNIVKHSNARNADVTIYVNSDQMHLLVNDDGKGFILEDAIRKSNRMGLKSILERSRESCATQLIINSSKEHGTETRVSWPIKKNKLNI